MSDVHLNLHIVKFFVLTLFDLVLFLLYIHLNSLAETFHCKYLVVKTPLNLIKDRSECYNMSYNMYNIDYNMSSDYAQMLD